MKNVQFLILVLFGICYSVLGTDMETASPPIIASGESLSGRVEASRYKRIQPKRALKVLTDSGNYFRYTSPHLIDPRPVPEQIEDICRNMKELEKNAEQLLSLQGEIPNRHYFRECGVLYANLPLLTGNLASVQTDTAKYALALLCARRYREAEQNLLQVLEKNPNDYGGMILLGLLSTRNKEYFPYLEKAFAVNPTKGVSFVEWHCQNLDMLHQLPQEWDFIGSYLPLVLRYRNSINIKSISPMTAMRLNKAIRERYFDKNYQILPEYRDQATEWISLCAYLVQRIGSPDIRVN